MALDDHTGQQEQAFFLEWAPAWPMPTFPSPVNAGGPAHDSSAGAQAVSDDPGHR